MQIDVLRPDDLTDRHLIDWTRLQEADPAAASPFLAPEWTLAAGRVIDDVRVAVLSEAGETVGFFPVQRMPDGRGRPPAGRLSDGEGIVLARGVQWDPQRVLRACGVRNLSFQHAPVDARGFAAATTEVLPSAHLDLSAGYDAYCRAREAAGTKLIKQTARKERKLEREHGPLRFEMHATDPDAVDNLIAWKTAMVTAQGNPAPFAGADWVGPLLTTAEKYRCDEFASVVSALYAGDRMVAVHWGLRTRDRFVSGVPAHDPDGAAYSPGTILALHLAREAAGAGITDLELGLGLNQTKVGLMTHTVPLATGLLDARLPRIRRAYRRLRERAGR